MYQKVIRNIFGKKFEPSIGLQHILIEPERLFSLVLLLWKQCVPIYVKPTTQCSEQFHEKLLFIATYLSTFKMVVYGMNWKQIVKYHPYIYRTDLIFST